MTIVNLVYLISGISLGLSLGTIIRSIAMIRKIGR